jgi:hypothetical protein
LTSQVFCFRPLHWHSAPHKEFQSQEASGSSTMSKSWA